MLCLSNLFFLLLVFNDVKESYAPHLLFLMILTGDYCQRSIKNCGSQIENHLCEMQISASGHGAANQSIELGPGTVARVCKESKAAAAASSFQVINICEGVYSSDKQHSTT